jgi:hypothetical protein
MEDISNYESIKEDSRKYYQQIGKVVCPAFGSEFVYFNSEGFNHLIFKGNRKEREKQEQITRFKLMPLALKLVKLATIYQEMEQTIQEFRVKKFKKIVDESKVVKYWGIIGILENRKIKVIIRQVGENGQKHFWSVIPAWVTNKYRDIKFATTMKGNPNED